MAVGLQVAQLFVQLHKQAFFGKEIAQGRKRIAQKEPSVGQLLNKRGAVIWQTSYISFIIQKCFTFLLTLYSIRPVPPDSPFAVGVAAGNPNQSVVLGQLRDFLLSR